MATERPVRATRVAETMLVTRRYNRAYADLIQDARRLSLISTILILLKLRRSFFLVSTIAQLMRSQDSQNPPSQDGNTPTVSCKRLDSACQQPVWHEFLELAGILVDFRARDRMLANLLQIVPAVHLGPLLIRLAFFHQTPPLSEAFRKRVVPAQVFACW